MASPSRPKGRLKPPLAVLVSYGPDDHTVTKVVVSVYVDPDVSSNIIKKWMGAEVASDPQVDGEIRQFLRTYRVKTLVVQPGVFGCPHEEEIDFPRGADCPHCPFWAGKQGSGATVEQRWAGLDWRKVRIIDVKEPGVRWSWRP